MSVESEWLGQMRALRASVDLGTEPVEAKRRRFDSLAEQRRHELDLADRLESEMRRPTIAAGLRRW